MNDNIINNTNERNVGLDLLKIISMIMVVILHILGHGGLLNSTEPLTLRNSIYWFIEILCYCAVDTYALISGYVNYDKKFKISHILNLWIRVLFYTILIFLVSLLFNNNFDYNTIHQSFFPLSNNTYWFFTCYIGMYIFSPFINKLVKSLSNKSLYIISIIILFIFSILPVMFHNQELFGLNNGYSVLWLSIMYFFGAVLKKTNILNNIKKYWYIIIYFVVSLIALLSYIVLLLGTKAILGEAKWGGYLVSYLSPFMIIQSISLMFIFKNINILNHKICKLISFISALSFSCYLIHKNPIIRIFFKDKLVFINNYNLLISIVIIFTIGVLTFIVCCLIDLIRHYLFKVIKLKHLLSIIDSKIEIE